MSITSDLLRGHTDTIILRRLMHQDSYGYEINKYIYKKRPMASMSLKRLLCIRLFED